MSRIDRDARYKILEELDLSAFRAHLGPEAAHTDDFVLLTAIHKARVEMRLLPARFRLESVEWLRENGFKRNTGEPLPERGVLPS